MIFLVFVPIINIVVTLICVIISACTNGGGSYSSSYSYDTSSLEAEMKRHNARMEEMMMEQEKARLQEEMYRIQRESEPSLAEKFDTRLTNIFRNPWEGIL